MTLNNGDLRLQESAVASYRAVAALPSANDFDVESLGNWLYNNKPLIREESKFIDHRDDLFALAPRQPMGVFDSYVHKFLRFRYLGGRGESVS